MGCCPGRNNPPSSPTCTTNCFRANNYTRACVPETPVECAGVYSIDLTTVNTDIQNCSNDDGDCPVVYQLVSYSSHFSAVTISAGGEVSATRASAADPNTMGQIKYRMYCSCNNYATTARIFICIDNLCANVLCPEDEVCTQCSGCQAVVPNASLT